MQWSWGLAELGRGCQPRRDVEEDVSGERLGGERGQDGGGDEPLGQVGVGESWPAGRFAGQADELADGCIVDAGAVEGGGQDGAALRVPWPPEVEDGGGAAQHCGVECTLPVGAHDCQDWYLLPGE